MTVHLVGAGPGDPGLITARGAELLATAQVVVHDRLANSALLDLAPASAERISVGKDPDRASPSQQEINALLVDVGRRFERVVRLKGGDPYVFARGAEEVAALRAAGVDVDVVPGVTSAIAAPAAAGIAVTRRYSATSFTVVTGHEDPAKPSAIDWGAVAQVGGTIVILMGVARIASITEQLVAGGLDPQTPAAAIRWGTRADQEVVRCTLGELPSAPLRSPSVIVVGDVVGDDLAAREPRRLDGLRVVVTRAASQASELSVGLAARGAHVVHLPTIAFEGPTDGGRGLAALVADPAAFDWVVVTSPNGARRLIESVVDLRSFGGVGIAAIGEATARVLRNARLGVDLVPERAVSEGLVAEFPHPDGPGGRVALVRAEIGRRELPDGLAALGWSVEVVPAYRTVPVAASDRDLAQVAGAHVVAFASGSAVDGFTAAVVAGERPPVAAVIGPVTATRARAAGFEHIVESSDARIDALVDAVEEWWRASDADAPN